MSKVIKTKVPRSLYIRVYLTLWNGSLKLTNLELDILEGFIEKFIELSKEIDKYSLVNDILFNSSTKKEIRTKYKIKSENTFNNYLVHLRKKSIILEDKENKGKYKLNDKVIPVNKITFEFEVYDV